VGAHHRARCWDGADGGVRELAGGAVKRWEKKRRSRSAKAARHDLVHAAGCSMRFEPFVCSSRLVERSDFDDEPLRVSVPRSLRHLLGRYVGGEK